MAISTLHPFAYYNKTVHSIHIFWQRNKRDCFPVTLPGLLVLNNPLFSSVTDQDCSPTHHSLTWVLLCSNCCTYFGTLAQLRNQRWQHRDATRPFLWLPAALTLVTNWYSPSLGQPPISLPSLCFQLQSHLLSTLLPSVSNTHFSVWISFHNQFISPNLFQLDFFRTCLLNAYDFLAPYLAL